MIARSARQRPLFSRADAPALLAGLFLAVPILAAIIPGILFGGGEAWTHIAKTLLGTYALTSVGTLFLTGLLILLIGVPAAWLVTMYDFPGRGLFEWVLILPLAAPGYVFAYAYADIMGVAGPLQTLLRDVSGLGARDYWFPDIRSLPGLAAILALTLYPYVYLTARAGFISGSICTQEAARSLGASPMRTFWSVALPTARPAIIAGLALALMEAAADYGAAEFLGVPTLTFGIVRAWGSFGDPAVAARLALVLLTLILTLTWIERFSRGRRGSQQSSTKWRPLARIRLTGLSAVAPVLFCTAIAFIAFILPVGHLVWLSMEAREHVAPIMGAFRNTLILAGGGAGLAFILAVIVALTIHSASFSSRFARLATAAGYAIPGAVLALGGLFILKTLGLSLTGFAALIILTWVYAARFASAGTEPLQAALARAPASVGHAARSLGAGPFTRAIKIDLPIAMSGASAGALILFVEVLKELPATLMLRPMNWDTLSVKAYAYASDERLAAAALPSLLITLAGLGPVILLSWRLSRARVSDRT